MRSVAVRRATSLRPRSTPTRRVAAMAPPSATGATAYDALTAHLKEMHALGVSGGWERAHTCGRERRLNLPLSLTLSLSTNPPSTQTVEALLGWDEMVMLPPGPAASDLRAAQKAALAGLTHAKATAPELGAALSALAAAPPPTTDPWASATVRLAARDYKRATAIPADLAQAKAALESKAYVSWMSARKSDDFSAFSSDLKSVFAMATKIAGLVDPSRDAYDVMLDEFEPGSTAARLEPLFDCVEASVVPLLQLVKAKGVPPPNPPPAPTPYAKDAQASLCHEVAQALGFDTDAGRLDVSPHPFTGGAPGDVRMTTRFKEGEWCGRGRERRVRVCVRKDPLFFSTQHTHTHTPHTQATPWTTWRKASRAPPTKRGTRCTNNP